MIFSPRMGLPRRIGAAAVLLALLILVTQLSIAGTFRDAVPQVALRLVPADAIARSRLAATLVSTGDDDQSQAARALARDAILRDPLSPVALRVLGATERDRSRANRLMMASQKLSHREAQTQLWLARESLRRGDLTGAVMHFDIALRTSSSSRSAVFPLLAEAAVDPRVEKQIIERMKERPTWAFSFAAFLTDNGPDPASTTRILGAYLDRSIPKELDMARSAVERLAYAREFDLAWKMYRDFDLGPANGDVAALRDGSFDQPEGAKPFGWTLANDSDLWASIGPSPIGRGKVLLMMATGVGQRVVASQMLRLRPGLYRLRAKIGNAAADEHARPVLDLACATREADHSLLELRPPAGSAGIQAVRGDVSIPQQCRFQRLSVRLAANDENQLDGPWIDDIALDPVR